MRNNPNVNFDDFKKSIEASFTGLKSVFPDFEFKNKPATAIISGKKCITAAGSYTLKGKSGSEKVQVMIYAVPIDNQFFQISFMDTTTDDNTLLFKKIASSIELK